MEKIKKSEILSRMNDFSEEMYFIFDTAESRFDYVNEAFEIITKRETSELYKSPIHLFGLSELCGCKFSIPSHTDMAFAQR